MVVASKSVTENKDLPSTIYSVANEIRNMGVDALPIQVDVRNDEQVKHMVKHRVERDIRAICLTTLKCS